MPVQFEELDLVRERAKAVGLLGGDLEGATKLRLFHEARAAVLAARLLEVLREAGVEGEALRLVNVGR